MALALQGFTSGNGAEVDTLNRQLTITPKTQDANSVPTNIGGGERLVVESDAGLITGTALNRSLNAQEFRRLQVGMDNLLFNEVFNGTATNTALWNTALTTFTQAQASGKQTLNSGSTTANSATAVIKTWRTFPIYSGFCTIFEAVAAYQASSNIIPNSCVEIGLGFAATTAAPTDGVFFRWNIAGNFLCVVNFNGSETVSAALTPPTANVTYKFRIVVGRAYVEFWLNNILQAIIATPTGAGLPVITQDLPIIFRVYNSTSLSPTSAVQLGIFSCSAWQPDLNVNRSYEMTLAGLGGSSIQGQSGTGAFGTTANHTNSTAAVNTALSVSTPNYPKLGGRFNFTAVGTAITDFPLFAFQVPAAVANVPGKTLYIRGIHISTMNSGAVVATTPTVLQWAIGVGSSTNVLTGAEAANAKAPRVVDLGQQYFALGAVIGYVPADLDVQFPYPLMCEAGNYVHIILCVPLGTATGSEVFIGTVMINGVFE
jgi:hypothetical protein